MKALFLKDFYMIKKQLRIYALVMVFYAVLFVPQGMGDMLAFMSVLFCMMTVITTMSFDETLKWDRYALSGPLTRRYMVRARYAWSIMIIGVGFAIGLLCYALLPLVNLAPRIFGQSFSALAGICLVALLALSVMIPCIYKLGAEKARLLLIGTILIPVGAIGAYARYAPPAFKQAVAQNAHLLPPVLLLLTLAALVISYKISLRIYGNKDF